MRPLAASSAASGEGIEEYPVFARIFFYASAFNEVDIMQNLLPPRIPRPNQTEAQRSGFGLEKEEGTKGYGACTAGGMYLVSSGKVEIIQNFPPPGIPGSNQTEAQRSGFGLEKEEGTKGYGACTAGGMYWVSSDAEEHSDEESFRSFPLQTGEQILRSAQDDSVKKPRTTA